MAEATSEGSALLARAEQAHRGGHFAQVRALLAELARDETLTAEEKQRALALRARLAEWGYDVPRGDDNALAAALVDFQRINGLKETGSLDKSTVAKLSMSREDRLVRLRYTLAAETAQPIDRTAPRLVIVNIPSYKLRAFESGQLALSSNVVVGRPKRPTPELSVFMKASSGALSPTLVPTFGSPPMPMRAVKP